LCEEEQLTEGWNQFEVRFLSEICATSPANFTAALPPYERNPLSQGFHHRHPRRRNSFASATLSYLKDLFQDF
jgi:hypothetical protein